MNQKFEAHGQTKLHPKDISKFLNQVNRIRLRLGPDNWRDECKDYIQKNGLQDIANFRPALPKINRQEINENLAEQIVAFSLDHPGWGVKHLSAALKSLNFSLSATAIYHILLKHQMGTKYQRLLKLQENPSTMTPEQFAMLKKLKPSAKKPYEQGKRPGKLLAQTTLLVGYFHNLGELYLQTVFDTYSNYTFGAFHLGKHCDDAVMILHNEVLPFFRDLQIPVSAMVTDTGRKYSGNPLQHYELYLQLNNIAHRRIDSKKTQDNFIKQFHQILEPEFPDRKNLFNGTSDLATLESRLKEWLTYYNHRCPAMGFQNGDQTPWMMIEEYRKGKG